MIASTQTNHPLAAVQSGHNLQASIELSCARLKSVGMRITQPRIAILTSLIKRSIPASIEQIHGDLPADTCDLVTVYRCLAVFQEIGLVRLSYFHNGASAYQITLNSDVAPYHIICKETNDVQELTADESADLRAAIARIEESIRARGHEKVSHIVEFFVDKTRLSANRAAAHIEMPVALQQRATAASVTI